MTSIETARELRQMEEDERYDDVYHPVELDHVVTVVTDEQRDIYGVAPSQWVFCAACDGALTTEEQATSAVYRPGRGLVHGVCPRPGTAPRIPESERVGRVAKWARDHR
jgi:hypothetical protein